MERRPRTQAPALCCGRAGTRPRMTDPTEHFSSRVDNYVRYRPSYPPAALAFLGAHCGLRPGAYVADVGSGTGILTALLLAAGAHVAAIEPNAGMRAAAERALAREPRFVSIAASAEATSLADGSIDLWIAAQAFHWFKVAATRREALRVVRAGAYGALLWNEHPAAGSAFLQDYEALVRRHAPDYDQVVGSRVDAPAMREFFGGEYAEERFPNQQLFDLEGLTGRLMSSSYAPEPGHPQHAPLLEGLRVLFARHERGGRVVFPYVTILDYAQLKPPR